jgi:polygalacturonase
MDLRLDNLPFCNGEQLVTESFQQALDAIDAAGGGTLHVPPGRYLLGTLCLPSYLTLYLEAGAALVASASYADFHQARTFSRAECSDRAMLYACGQTDITIAGAGQIFGNADAYFSSETDAHGYRMPAEKRPRMIVFEDCRHIRLHGITLCHAPMWTVHLVSCRHVSVVQVTIDNDLSMANTDALDIDSCQHVHISHSYFSAADDGICIKTTDKPDQLRGPTRCVVIHRCILRSYSCAFKIGTETFDDIEDVVMSECTIFDSNRGIGLVSRDGGHLRRLQFSRITFECHHVNPCHWGKADPIFISCRHRDPAIAPGNISWVSFSHLNGTAEGAINLHADTFGTVHHVSIDHLQLQQLPTDDPQQGLYDIRPPCNPTRPTGSGLDNAYCLNPKTGLAFGVAPYPDGLPAIYARGIAEFTLNQLCIDRPVPLPDGWDLQTIVQI